jgi:hypothetical protein
MRCSLFLWRRRPPVVALPPVIAVPPVLALPPVATLAPVPILPPVAILRPFVILLASTEDGEVHAQQRKPQTGAPRVQDHPGEQNAGHEEEADDHEQEPGVHRAEVVQHLLAFPDARARAPTRNGQPELPTRMLTFVSASA